MQGEIKLTSILPTPRAHNRWIDCIAHANDASYSRLVPQALMQLNSIGEIQYMGEPWGKKLVRQSHLPKTIRAIHSIELAVNCFVG
jgi:hypothetical protein